MKTNKIKKMLAGLSVIGLISGLGSAGSADAGQGCGSSCGKGSCGAKGTAAGEVEMNDAKSSCGKGDMSVADAEAKSSCGKGETAADAAADAAEAVGSCGKGSCGKGSCGS